MSLLDELKNIPIKIATPEMIQDCTYGEITKPTNSTCCKFSLPKKDKLFCENIFSNEDLNSKKNE